MVNDNVFKEEFCEFEQFYNPKVIHKFLAEDNYSIRMQAYDKAQSHGGYELFGLVYGYGGGNALLQMAANGKEQILIEKYHKLNVDVFEDGMIAVRTSLRNEEAIWQSSLVVGTHEGGFDVVAHNLSKEECLGILQSYNKEFTK